MESLLFGLKKTLNTLTRCVIPGRAKFASKDKMECDSILETIAVHEIKDGFKREAMTSGSIAHSRDRRQQS